MSGVPENWVESGKEYSLLCEIPRVKPTGTVVWVIDGIDVETDQDSSANDGEPTFRITGSSTATFSTDQDEVTLTCKLLDPDHNIWEEQSYKTVQVYCKFRIFTFV